MNRLMILINAVIIAVSLSLPVLAETTAIVGGKVHTVGPEGTIENATIVIHDGVITAVGSGVGVPDGATVIDATGKIVTPGLFSPTGQIGLTEVSG